MDLSKYRDFKYYSSWSECSKDDEHNEIMINSEVQVVDFDLVKRKYLNALGKSEECAASVDVLAEDENGDVYMIEFKNGEIDADNIRKKVTESLLIYTDITHKTIKDTRENLSFILVYNPDRKHFEPQRERAIHLARMGKGLCKEYGLDKYQGTYFLRAYMMTEAQFANKLLTKLK